MTYEDLVPVIRRLAIEAGAKIMEIYNSDDFDVKVKSDESPVTAADEAADALISAGLRAAFPEMMLVTEEQSASHKERGDTFLIVDPLDGTTNFLHGLPHWAISIALEHKSEIVSGVIYDPAKDEMFYAEKGEGAWLNDSQRLRVSGRNRMIESIFATGVPFGGRRDLPETLQDLARIMPACAGVRRWGSAALDLAYVAAGRYEGYWERNLNAWDVAAGIIIVKEAGGFVRGMADEDNVLETGSVLAANEPIWDQFAKVIRGA